MPSLEFEVYCECGAGLCRQTRVKGDRVIVEPCAQCLEAARDKGKDDRDDEVSRLEDEIIELESKLEKLEKHEHEG